MMLQVPEMPPEYDEWLGGVVPAWTALEPGRIDALMGEPPFEDGAIRLAIDLTDDEIAHSPMLQNAFVLMRAAEEADGLKLTAKGNLTRETVEAMREAMDWPGLPFEEKWRAGKQLREQDMQELRLVRELALMDGLLIRKHGRLGLGAEGPAGTPAGERVPELLLAGEPRPVRRARMRIVAPAADRSGAVVAGDDGRSVAGHRDADAPQRAA